MVSSRPKLGLSRKFVALHLFFALTAVCWLAVGLGIASHALLCNQAANHCLLRLDKGAAAIDMHWLRRGAAGLDSLLSELRHDSRAVYCAVVGLDGRFLAHTNSKLVGTPAVEPAGSRTQDGELTAVRYQSDDGQTLSEFRTPLKAGDQDVGELRVAVDEPSLLATLQAAAHFIPLPFLAPAVALGAGAWFAYRLAKPLTIVEARLREAAQTPVDDDLTLTPLRANDAMTLGWNRIVDELDRYRRLAKRWDMQEILAQAAREKSDVQFKEILQRLSDGIAVTDATGRLAFANRAVAALLGKSEETEFPAGCSLQEMLLSNAECSEDSELLSPETLCRTAIDELTQSAGETDRVLRVARLPLGADASLGHVWSLRDVTQQKLVEQTRDRFIDTATHELRTPLANIKAYAETLASVEALDVELQKEFCNTINSEVTRLARFIDDLLSISSMEAGALTVERQKVETSRLFAEVLAKVEPLMQQKQLDFEVELPPKMPELQLDKDKINAVLVNILGNAAKYTPAGGRVSLNVMVEDGRLRAAVQDSGVGIAADELEKVFEKFFRSEDPRVQAEVGSGLGLSLAREVVRMHGGEITVESVLNQGSTFTVSLPLS